MKLLVCLSKTPDTTSRIEFSSDGKEFVKDGVQFILNPYDEWYSLVRALELKEKFGGSVTVINVGDISNDTIIRKALAIGADDAVRLDAEPKSALFVAQQISSWAKGKDFDIIFLGKETIDYNGSQVGAMLSEYLDLPYISYANNLEVDGEVARLSRPIEGGVEIVEVSLPFVLSASKGMAEQRIPNMRGIMMAKRKPLIVEVAEGEDSSVSVFSFSKPPAKSTVKLIDPDNMDELVKLLHEEAKVI